MTALAIPTPRMFWRDPTTDMPLVGGKVYFYIAGTTTPKDTWADYEQASANTNPVILQADGGADIYGNGAYKISVHRADDTLVHEIDDIVVNSGSGGGGGGNGAEAVYTVNHTITAAEDGMTIIANRPTPITFAFENAAVLGSTFAVRIKNIGLGDLTLDPALSETIDGDTLKVLHYGQSAFIRCNGIGLRSLYVYPEVQVSHSYRYTIDPVGGNDANSGLDASDALKTPQQAILKMPPLNSRQSVEIFMINGVYAESILASGDMERPALIHIDGLKIGKRTDAPGGVMVGGLVIRGESKAGVILRPQGANGLTRGVYLTGHVGSVGFQNFTVDALTGAEAGIVSHRGGYAHLEDIEVDGNTFMTFGLIAEAGGFMECLGLDVHHNVIGAQAYQGSTLQMSLSSTLHDNSSLDINIPNGGYVGLTTASSAAGGVTMQAGGKFDCTGISSSRVVLGGTLNLRGGAFSTAFTDITGPMTTYADLEMNTGATGWSNAWTDYGAGGYVPGMVSWVSPATQSTVATPLAHITGRDNLFKDATFRIINSSGVEVAESANGSAISVPASSAPLTSNIRSQVNVGHYTATANRTNITLPNAAMPGRIATAPVPAGTVWYIFGASSFTIQLVPGATADFSFGAVPILIGTSSGAYMGVMAVMGTTGLWRVSPLGAVRP